MEFTEKVIKCKINIYLIYKQSLLSTNCQQEARQKDQLYRLVIKANINQFTQNNFINASNSVNPDLHTHHHTLDADMNTTGFIKERTNEHVCEFVDNIDKYFWDVLRLNTKDDIKQHYFQTQFKL
ncbi:Hypothetical_protein [Hexamita inflata]|uniref:Hypothetical_protein n=1 Tax=Hexamita inflata TaxID=28002 RepID=A0AA86P530_9EUKA|nr:Hypothetical protein HINF_LOCUS19566 [Hexamita inflata]